MSSRLPAHNDLTALLNELILPFYLIKRDMRVPIGPRRLETTVEHSWALAAMACALAPQIDPSLDVGKVAQFAIVHDWVELYATDTTPFGSKKKLASKETRERQAVQRIAGASVNFPWIAQTITEYESRQSSEAKFVWATDKYITLLTRHQDNGKFYRTSKLTKEKFDERIAGNRAKAHAHKTIGLIYDELKAQIDAQPDQFYQKG